MGLRPHVEAAFASSHVAIDFAGFSSETLHGVLQEPLDKIRAGRLTPEAVIIRVLLPDLSGPTLIPSRAADGVDDPDVRARASRIARRHTEAIVESVRELHDSMTTEFVAQARLWFDSVWTTISKEYEV